MRAKIILLLTVGLVPIWLAIASSGWTAKAAPATRPERIVTLAPSLNETVADLLGPDLDRLVGVAEPADYPPGLQKKPSVGPYHRINLESVAALKPDLVLATHDGNSSEQVERLQKLGLRVEVVQEGSFSEMANTFSKVGAWLGQDERGQALARRLREGIASLRQRGQARGRTSRVLVELNREPLVVAGGASYLSEALTAVGATNVYADLPQAYPHASREDAVKRNPDVILVMTFAGAPPTEFDAAVRDWTRFKELGAVKTQSVRKLEGERLLRPGPRLLEGLMELARAVAPKGSAP